MTDIEGLRSAISAHASEHPRASVGEVFHKGRGVFVKYFRGAPGASQALHAQQGLEHLGAAVKASGCATLLKIPAVICAGNLAANDDAKIAADTNFVAMELLHLQRHARSAKAGILGECLARVHLQDLQVGTFGFAVDGFCGEGVQLNNAELREVTWVEFWREFRLRPQLDQLQRTAGRRLLEKGERLCKQLDELFAMIHVQDIQKSCLHGDLWSGNWAGLKAESSTENGNNPVVAMFDPACYYGHHEADLGIARMFGMPKAFYDAYHSKLPKQPGFEQRAMLYELHHHLNHANIFGVGAYGAGAEALLDQLLATLHRRG